MEFNYNEKLDLWVSSAKFQGRDVQVRLYCSDSDDFEPLASRAIGDVQARWRDLKSAMVSELLPQFREQATQDIEPDEFFDRLVLEAIDFDTYEIMYTLYFADSGLFGGHSIKVRWDPEAEFLAKVSLVG